jgi:hypothetical protein
VRWFAAGATFIRVISACRRIPPVVRQQSVARAILLLINLVI